jgi:penicillin-binding protein 1C
MVKIQRYIIKSKNLYLSLPKSARKIVLLFSAFFFLFLSLNTLFPLTTDINYSTIVLSNNNTLLNGYLTSDDKWRMYTKLDEISPALKKAIIFKEDRFFHYHFGINPAAMIRAAINNIRQGKRTSGASTITMQVARLLSPKERTYKNKLTEMFRALQLEWKYSKNEILQLYLNLVPYGGNIEGVKAASVIYFGKMPNHLSIAEITALSIIPNRPVSLRLGKNNDHIIEERNKWLLRFKSKNLFSVSDIHDAISEPLRAYRRPVPNLAPHLSNRLKRLHPEAKIIRSTLDLEMQRKCEKIVGDYSKSLYFRNIKNATAIIIKNKSRKVLAYVGSADFYNSEDGGQVDGIRAIRSPGSTLKPLAYALAIDRGGITPKTTLNDVPVSFSGYEPENYDEKFYGRISAEDALARSLNIPAVKILADIQTGNFLSALINANFQQIKKEKNNLGLSSVLGGCGASLEEISGLYCTMANKGKFLPLKYTDSSSKTDTIKITSEGAAFMITEVLTKLERPDLPMAWENSFNTPKIAWKTGTSYGRKDAWSIGYNNHYTVGVWVGNFSGEGVPELSGAEKATPLLFRIFNSIDHKMDYTWFTKPDEVELRYICSQTGFLPGNNCNDLIIDYFLPGTSNNSVCHHLKDVLINPDSTFSYCLSCRPDFGYKNALFPNLDPELIDYYNSNQIAYQKIPEHNPECERIQSGQAPVIISPIHNNEYFINIEEEMELKLSCQAANDAERVFWYINDKFFKQTAKEEDIFFSPPEGSLKISCSDDLGRNTTITITVKHTDM